MKTSFLCWSALFISLLTLQTSYAATVSDLAIQNINPYYFMFTGQNAQKAHCSGACYLSLNPKSPSKEGGQQWVQVEENGYIVLSYDVCKDVRYDDKGKPNCVDYQAHFDVQFTKASTQIVSQQGSGTVKLGAYDKGVFPITFSPKEAFPKPSSYQEIPYRGVNLSGADFENFLMPGSTDALYFVKKGMNIMRLPFAWEHLQPNLKDPIDFTKGNAKRFADVVDELTAQKVYVLIDMHNYMRYGIGYGKRHVVGQSKEVTAEDYAKTWAAFAARFKDNPYVMFDLMNEPFSGPDGNDSAAGLKAPEVPLKTETILDNYNKAIAAIRQQGFKNLVMVEGSSWSGLFHWTRDWYGTPNSVVFVPGKIIDPMDNYAINVHEYFDDPEGGGGGMREGDCVVSKRDPKTGVESLLTLEKFPEFMAWVRKNHVKVFLSELNGRDLPQCKNDIDIFLKALEANSYQEGQGGFIGWTVWAGGPYWGNYPMSITPDENGREKGQMTDVFAKHLQPAAK